MRMRDVFLVIVQIKPFNILKCGNIPSDEIYLDQIYNLGSNSSANNFLKHYTRYYQYIKKTQGRLSPDIAQ